MKYLYVSCLLLTMLGCQSNCEDFDIEGHWEVESVNFDDSEGLMKSLVEEQGGNYDAYLESTKLFNDIEYYFKPNGELFVVNPKELGESGEGVYDYTPYANTIVIGDRVYDISIEDCDHITITDVALEGSALFHMYCTKVK